MLGGLLGQLQGNFNTANAPDRAPARGEATRPGGLRGILQGVGINGIPMTNTGGFRQPNYMGLLGMQGSQPPRFLPQTTPIQTPAPGGNPAGTVTPEDINQYLIDNGMMTTIQPYNTDGIGGIPWNGQIVREGGSVPTWVYQDFLNNLRAGG